MNTNLLPVMQSIYSVQIHLSLALISNLLDIVGLVLLFSWALSGINVSPLAAAIATFGHGLKKEKVKESQKLIE